MRGHGISAMTSNGSSTSRLDEATAARSRQSAAQDTYNTELAFSKLLTSDRHNARHTDLVDDTPGAAVSYCCPKAHHRDDNSMSPDVFGPRTYKAGHSVSRLPQIQQNTKRALRDVPLNGNRDFAHLLHALFVRRACRRGRHPSVPPFTCMAPPPSSPTCVPQAGQLPVWMC